jgi:hypothetical protein
LLAGFSGVTVGTQLWVTVGAGGTAAVGYPTYSNPTNGNNSVLVATSSGAITGNIVALGGGYGANGENASARVGGSGGNGGGGSAASGATVAAGSGTSGQGNAGGSGGFLSSNYTGGGGGGAGTVGLAAVSPSSTSIGGNGGAGIASSISGAVVTYAGGGGGGNDQRVGTQSVGIGGVGGGGAGQVSNASATSGTANTGGGGGGSGYSNSAPYIADSGAGGSGIVILRYPDTFRAATSTTGSPTITVAGGFRVYQFTASGSITFYDECAGSFCYCCCWGWSEP